MSGRQLFAAGLDAMPLHAIVFLDGFAPRPALTPLAASFQTATRLTPVTSTLWGISPAQRAFALVRLLAGVPAYALRVGEPDPTAHLIEETFTQ